MIVHVSRQRMLLAEIMAREIAERTRKPALFDTFYLGYIFEQGFYTACKNKLIRYVPTTAGADNGDFELWTKSGFGILADAKLAGQTWHKNLIVPRDQALRHVYPLYIAGRVMAPDMVQICGFVRPDELMAAEQWPDAGLPADMLFTPLDTLHPIQELLDKLADGTPYEEYPPSVMASYRDLVVTTIK